MPYHIQKCQSLDGTKKQKQVNETIALTTSTISQSTEINSCYYCEKKCTRCLASEKQSSHCSQCVKDYKFHCKTFDTAQQSFQISRRRDQLDSAVEAAEEEVMLLMARDTLLHKQRNDWLKKAARAVSCGINNLEELERVEQEQEEAGNREEAARQTALLAAAGPSHFIDAINWFAFILDPLLFPPLEPGSIPKESPGLLRLFSRTHKSLK